MSLRIVALGAVLVAAAITPAMAANDGIPQTTTQPQVGQDVQPSGPKCRQAKAGATTRPQLTAEERARRKAMRAQHAAEVIQVSKPRSARLPLC